MDDVKGLAAVTEDVRRSLDLFLAGRTFRRQMGGTPRRGLLFEGPPGTGKTYLAKAMAAEAGVPFLFVSATSFQSMYYGATARKIRSYFAALRKVARAEGGAIGFIEEIDAIATVRGGMYATAAGAGVVAAGPFVHRATISEGVGGVVNELLVQLQSFDTSSRWQQARGAVTGAVNRLLPAHHQIPAPRPEPVDVLLIAATNRASRPRRAGLAGRTAPAAGDPDHRHHRTGRGPEVRHRAGCADGRAVRDVGHPDLLRRG